MEYSSFSMVLYKTSVFLYELLNDYTIRLMGEINAELLKKLLLIGKRLTIQTVFWREDSIIHIFCKKAARNCLSFNNHLYFCGRIVKKVVFS